MTAQAPERIILDGRPRAFYADPLSALIERHDLDVSNPNFCSTANYRGYIGTWEILDQSLCLTHLSWENWNDGSISEVSISDAVRRQLCGAAGCFGFPVPARWFNGTIRIEIGKRLIYSHHGWSHWFERERVIRFAAGEVVRDREVDTRAILEWWLRRNPEASDALSGHDPLGPLMWFDNDDDEDWSKDWWPPDYARGH
jgi:hypothetical protein